MRISVVDMSCSHCEKKIGNALKENGVKASIDLGRKEVTIENDNDLKAALLIIADLGYSVKCE